MELWTDNNNDTGAIEKLRIVKGLANIAHCQEIISGTLI